MSDRWTLYWIAVLTVIFTGLLTSELYAAEGADENLEWIVLKGEQGPGTGKQIVLVAGDEEYRSEEALPQLAKILAGHHGFDCRVVFSISPDEDDPGVAVIDPENQNNIPGLEALKSADLMIIATRFRDLKDEQMQHIVDYLDAGKPVLGMRTATHAFKIKKGKKFSKYSYNSQVWDGGFGRQILGETWINHHGHHGRESTRAVVAEGMESHPIARGCDDVWGPSDVYTVRLPLPEGSRPIFMGQVLTGMEPTDEPVAGEKNSPMMPVGWTKTYRAASGQQGRVFTTTMGAATDLVSEGTRRMLVNATYWCVGLEEKIPERANVAIVGDYNPSPFGFGTYRRGIKPSDLLR